MSVTRSTSNEEGILLVALVLLVCDTAGVALPITLDTAGGVLLLEALAWVCWRGGRCSCANLCRLPLWRLAVRCETISAPQDGY